MSTGFWRVLNHQDQQPPDCWGNLLAGHSRLDPFQPRATPSNSHPRLSITANPTQTHPHAVASSHTPRAHLELFGGSFKSSGLFLWLGRCAPVDASTSAALSHSSPILKTLKTPPITVSAALLGLLPLQVFELSLTTLLGVNHQLWGSFWGRAKRESKWTGLLESPLNQIRLPF